MPEPDPHLTPEFLAWAYRQGAFPMAGPDGEIEWYRSDERAVFDLSGIRVSRSLARTLRRGGFQVTFDTAFEQTMRLCLRPRDNWINEPLIQLYSRVHREGWGHSCEVWVGEDQVGGVYGVAVGGCFCAESMFHRKTDMSKVALKFMVDRCREEGFLMFDAQVMNPHLASLGATSLTHHEYLERLELALPVRTSWS